MVTFDKYGVPFDENGTRIEHLNVNDDPTREIALKLYEQRQLQFRHFDNLRWQVPGVVGTLGVLILRFGANGNGQISPNLLLGYGLFSTVCGYFLHRLIIHMNLNATILKNVGRMKP